MVSTDPNLTKRINAYNLRLVSPYISIRYTSYSKADRRKYEDSGITSIEYQRIYDHYGKQSRDLTEENVIIETVQVRRDTYTKKVSGTVSYEISNTLYTKVDPEYPYTYSLYTKNHITPKDWNKNYHKVPKKQVYRYLFYPRSNVTVILEKVLNEGVWSYGIVLESRIKTKNALASLEKENQVILSVLYDTIFKYTIKKYKEIVKLFNSISTSDVSPDVTPDGNTFDTNLIEDHRNIHRNDLVRGGIIENPNTLYSITHNVDGERRFLIFGLSSAWLVDPTTNSIKNILGNLPETAKAIFDHLDGMIVDGVLVPKDKMRINDKGKVEVSIQGSEVFYVYDMIQVKKRGYTNRPFMATYSYDQKPIAERYDKRLIHGFSTLLRELYSNKRNGYTLQISHLDHIFLVKHRNINMGGKSLDTFPLAIKEMLDKQKKVNFPSKGLIFRPALKKYSRVVARERVLTKVMDVCKWEPGVKSSINLQLKDGQLRVYSESKGELVLFKGTKEQIFTNSMIDYDDILFQEDVEEKIIEFRWDEQKGMLSPIKIKYTSVLPDSTLVGEDVWNSMLDPISEDTLLGNDNKLFVYQQYRLRRNLLKEASKGILNPHLVDLNALPSSVDIWKSKYKRVIAIVPSEDRANLISDIVIDIYGYSPLILTKYDANAIKKIKDDGVDVVIYQGNIEDSSTLLSIVYEFIEDRADVVSSFYSIEMSKGPKRNMKKSMDTISQLLSIGGKFIYVMLNADNLETNLDTNIIRMDVEGEKTYTEKEKTIEFNLDTVPEINDFYGYYRNSVSDPVVVPKLILDELIIGLKDRDFTLEKNLRSDGEKSLHFRSYLLSILFNFGVFEKESVQNDPLIVTKSKPLKKQRLAYVFLLMKGNSYLPGILTVAQSLKMTGSDIDRVCMITKDKNISKSTIDVIKKSGLFARIVEIEYLKAPHADMSERSTGIYYWMGESYTKWQCLNLYKYYDKVLLLDADLIVVKNIDHLFELEAPAATFSYPRSKRFTNGVVIENNHAMVPQLHGARVDNELVVKFLMLEGQLTASMVLLEPNEIVYNRVLDYIDRLNKRKDDIVAYGIGYEEATGKKIKKKFSLINLAGTDERFLSYIYSVEKEGNEEENIVIRKGSWRNIHPRYNMVVAHPDWVVKPGTLDPDTGRSRYYSPSVFHYIQETKPWQGDIPKVATRDFITNSFWYYIFTSILLDNKVKKGDVIKYVTENRMKQVNTIISKKLYPKYFKYEYKPSLHGKMFPWLSNKDFNPFDLKWKPGEKPEREREWSYDPETIFIVSSINYKDPSRQPYPGKAPNEKIPRGRMKEFEELHMIPNWRYQLYLDFVTNNGYPKSDESKDIVFLTKNAALASGRDLEKDITYINANGWTMMNSRFKLSKKEVTKSRTEDDVKEERDGTKPETKPRIRITKPPTRGTRGRTRGIRGRTRGIRGRTRGTRGRTRVSSRRSSRRRGLK